MDIRKQAQQIVLDCHYRVNESTNEEEQIRLVYQSMPALVLIQWLDKNPDGDADQYLSQEITRLTEEYRSESVISKSHIRNQVSVLYSLRDCLCRVP